MKQIRHKRLIVLFILISAAILFIIVTVKLRDDLSPKVYSESILNPSDTQKRDDLFRKINFYVDGHLPDNAKNLYYGTKWGFWDYTYAAFCLESEEQCKTFLEKYGYRFSDFKKGNISSEEVWGRGGPHTWPKKYQDRNWPLLQETELYYQVTKYRSYVIYVPGINRIYFHDDPSP